MKLDTYSVRDCYAALGIGAFLVLTAWGNAIAMFAFSVIALIIWFLIQGFGR